MVAKVDDGEHEKRPGIWVANATGKILRTECCICKIPEPPGFMLRLEVWMDATKPEERHGVVCIPCIELRLRRPLRATDLVANLKVNAYWLRDIAARELAR